MRWLLNEVQEFLKRDADLRLLIVEGAFDVDLWARLVPRPERANVNIYPIGSIEVPGPGLGGEKGRILSMARVSGAWPENDRLMYFVDSDFDRIVGAAHPTNVVVSDGRDAESYILTDEAFACFCETGAGERPHGTALLRGIIRSVLRPMGMLRFADHIQGWRLPFQATLAAGGVERFFRHNRGSYSLRFPNLIDALISRLVPPPRSAHQGRRGSGNAGANRLTCGNG